MKFREQLLPIGRQSIGSSILNSLQSVPPQSVLKKSKGIFIFSSCEMEAAVNAPPGSAPVAPEHERILRQRIAGLLDIGPSQFPGAQPVSFLQEHLEELQHEDYFVSEKSDGTRYLMYITLDAANPPQQNVYLVGKNFINNCCLICSCID